MKMRNSWKILIVWILLSGLFACDTASNTEDPDLNYFVKYYGGDGQQYGVDMLPLADGSFLLLGTDVYDIDGVYSRIYLVKVDGLGSVVWEQRYGDLKNIITAKDLEETGDGNFIVVADVVTEVSQKQQTDIRLLKISPDGTLLQTKQFGTEANDFSKTITLLADGGFMVSGTTEFTETFVNPNDPDPDRGDVMNYRLDQNLNQVPINDWSPVYPGFGANLDVAVSGIERPDGSFYFFGYTNSTISGDLNPNGRLGLFYFLRSSTGTLGNVYYPGNIVNVNDTEIHFVEPVVSQLGDGFLVIGTSQNNVGLSDVFIARLRGSLSFAPPLQNDATLYTTVPLGRNVRGVAAASSTTGEYGYLILGNEVRSTGATNLWLSKVNQSGTVLWSTTFGSEAQNDFGAAVTQLADGKVIILGTMGLADKQFKMALIKMNPRGQLLK